MLLQVSGEAYKVYVIASSNPGAEPLFEAIVEISSQLVAVRMVLVGIATLRARVWRGWRTFTPLLVGLYIYLVPFPSLIITGNPPGILIGLWGVSWLLLGYAIWSSVRELQPIPHNNPAPTQG